MNDYLETTIGRIFSKDLNIQQDQGELRQFLDLLDKELKPKRTVEIGSWHGFNAALLSLVTDWNTVSIDPVFEDRSEALSLADNLTFYTGNGHDPKDVIEVLSLLGGLPDLVFIDGDHSIEAVAEDHRIWMKLVRPGGWIAFHDINPKHEPVCPGPTEFWQKLVGNKEEIIINGHEGIGLLRL